MLSPHHIAWSQMEAERAFGQAKRARRRASVTRRLLRRCAQSTRLVVHDQRSLVARSAASRGVREIPLDAIRGTFDPGRANQFDGEFRPAEATRRRWLSVWVAEMTGAALPPISVMQIGDSFAVIDGHHRVSVAVARGAATIPAVVA